MYPEPSSLSLSSLSLAPALFSTSLSLLSLSLNHSLHLSLFSPSLSSLSLLSLSLALCSVCEILPFRAVLLLPLSECGRNVPLTNGLSATSPQPVSSLYYLALSIHQWIPVSSLNIHSTTHMIEILYC